MDERQQSRKDREFLTVVTMALVVARKFAGSDTGPRQLAIELGQVKELLAEMKKLVPEPDAEQEDAWERRAGLGARALSMVCNFEEVTPAVLEEWAGDCEVAG